jgi:3-deoxy-manno-octulosonate cytidylyltransferase (CMP-KDO synthetase)
MTPSLPLICVGIIPARWKSTRLPGKVLADLGGKTILQHVWENCVKSKLTHVVIATDSEDVLCLAKTFGAEVVMTDAGHPNGTLRCVEAFRKLFKPSEIPLMMNIQGDEPFLSPDTINNLISYMAQNAEADIGTTYYATEDKQHALRESVVKLVTDYRGRVLYFSRALIPHVRSDIEKPVTYKIHAGLYAFRTAILEKLQHLEYSELEGLEMLEQLRWLYHGLRIYATEVSEPTFSIDTPEDLERAREMYLHRRNPS